MGAALARGWLKAKPKRVITVTEPNPSEEVSAWAEAGKVRLNAAPAPAGILVLAVKPQAFAGLAEAAAAFVGPKTLVVSIMAGVRIAFMAGCQRVIDRVDQYRTNIGYGVSTLAQRAGESAFTHADQLVPPIVAEYKTRRDAIVASFQQAGWPVASPKGSMYLWLRVPATYSDWEWVDALMQGPGVVVTPGIAFGDAGRGHFRISFVRPAADLAEGARRIASLALTSRALTSPERAP